MKTIQLRPLSSPPTAHRAPAPGQYDTNPVYDGLNDMNYQAAEEARRQQYFRAVMESKGYQLIHQ